MRDERSIDEVAGEPQVSSSPLSSLLPAWLELLSRTDEPASVYDGWVGEIASTALEKGLPNVAGACLEYLLDFEAAEEAWREDGSSMAVARCLLRAERLGAAAESYERVSSHARAAAAWEEAGELDRAVRAWKKAASWFENRKDGYRQALSKLNEGLVALELGSAEGRRALAAAMVLLEEEADLAEVEGRLDRALACYHALIHIGRRTASHENLAEGFLNCIRLMQEAEHGFFVLQYFHDFFETSTKMGEHHAAAEIMRDASAWCRRRGMLYAEHFLTEAASAFEAAASSYLEAGNPVDLAESVLLAALDCHNRRGDVVRVCEVYERLYRLPLSGGKRERYARLARAAKRDADLAPAPAQSWRFLGYYDQETAYPPTWRTDLLEPSASSADPTAPTVDAIGDVSVWEVVRRRCLLVFLHRVGQPDWLTRDEVVRKVVAELTRAGSPLAIAPLLSLSKVVRSPDARVMIVEAAKHIPFRGSLDVISTGLNDGDSKVREAALAAMRHMAFPGAFPPLIRLFRESDSGAARRQVALTLGRLVGLEQRCSRDALDFLIQTLREGADPSVEEEIRMAISSNSGPASLVTIEHHIAAEAPGEVREFLERVVSRVEARRALDALNAMELGV